MKSGADAEKAERKAYALSMSKLSDLKTELKEKTLAMPNGTMQIDQEQGELMKFIVRTAGAKRGIEIGTFTGYSSICFAEAIGPEGHLLCCDVSEEWTSIAREYWKRAGLEDRITLKLAPAIQTLNELVKDEKQHGAWDFGFIDADKESQIEYYEALLKLVKKGGFIIVDNALMRARGLAPGEFKVYPPIQ